MARIKRGHGPSFADPPDSPPRTMAADPATLRASFSRARSHATPAGGASNSVFFRNSIRLTSSTLICGGSPLAGAVASQEVAQIVAERTLQMAVQAQSLNIVRGISHIADHTRDARDIPERVVRRLFCSSEISRPL